MRGNGKIASGALAVFLGSRLAGLICLTVLGMSKAAAESAFLLPALCILLAAMTISIVVMLFALPRKR